MNLYPHFSWFFDRIFSRHCNHRHKADYEVCKDPLCILSAWLERWLWWGGQPWGS